MANPSDPATHRPAADDFDRQVRIPSDTAEGLKLQERLLARLAELGYDETIVFGVKMALEEALVNAIKHGNGMDPDKPVDVRWSIDETRFLIEIEDRGAGFDPDDLPDPTAPENLERPCGRGVLLMKHYMTDVQWIPPGNLCRMSRVNE